MNNEFTEEQEELFKMCTITVRPCFNGEFTMETRDQDGNFLGRFNATDVEMLIDAVAAAYTDKPPNFKVN